MGPWARRSHRPARALALIVAVALAALLPPAAGARGSDVPVIVRAASADAAQAAVEAVGGTVGHRLAIVDGVSATVAETALDDLAAVEGVVDVSADEPVHVQAVSPVHQASAVYPKAVGADRLWKRGIDGDGVRIAVIDTGIAKVPDLAGRVVAGVDFSGENKPFRDSFGHGTFVAGLIAGNGTASGGKYRGVAPNADLVSVKIAGANGASDVSHVLAALQWVVSFKDTYGIRAVNLSLGTDSTQPYRMSPLNFAVERAWDSGLVVVVSASNRGLNGRRTVTKPGDDPLVVTVGATDDRATVTRRDDVMAGFSGMGPTADGLHKPDIVAPGRSVISLRAPASRIDNRYPTSRVGTSYFKGSGTSFSTGITSGAVALLLDKEPWLSPNQVKHRLLSKAAPGPVHDPDVDGKGSLNALAAADAGTTTAANGGVARSLGLGTLAADRGTLGVRLLTGTTATLLNGELTAQNTLFNGLEYVTTSWSSTSWYTSQWSGTSWYSTSWYGTSWYGTSWYSTSWYGTSWYGAAWE